jgi:hypothetical protein
MRLLSFAVFGCRHCPCSDDSGTDQRRGNRELERLEQVWNGAHEHGDADALDKCGISSGDGSARSPGASAGMQGPHPLSRCEGETGLSRSETYRQRKAMSLPGSNPASFPGFFCSSCRCYEVPISRSTVDSGRGSSTCVKISRESRLKHCVQRTGCRRKRGSR